MGPLETQGSSKWEGAMLEFGRFHTADLEDLNRGYKPRNVGNLEKLWRRSRYRLPYAVPITVFFGLLTFRTVTE